MQTNLPKENRGSIQVIERMMRLIDVLAQQAEPVTLKQLAQDADLHASTAHRILGMLTQQAWVERNENGAYRLGIGLLALGNLVKARISLREVALPFMQKLHLTTGESVNLGMRTGNEIVYVERTSSGRSAVRIVHIVGARAPLHTTATGKLFLAQTNQAEIEEYARVTRLQGTTPASITSLDKLLEALQQVRADKVAYDMEEVEMGVRCIAAGIYDDSNQLVAGLSLSTPAERFNAAWAELVQTTADEISHALGRRV